MFYVKLLAEKVRKRDIWLFLVMKISISDNFEGFSPINCYKSCINYIFLECTHQMELIDTHKATKKFCKINFIHRGYPLVS